MKFRLALRGSPNTIGGRDFNCGLMANAEEGEGGEKENCARDCCVGGVNAELLLQLTLRGVVGLSLSSLLLLGVLFMLPKLNGLAKPKAAVDSAAVDVVVVAVVAVVAVVVAAVVGVVGVVGVVDVVDVVDVVGTVVAVVVVVVAVVTGVAGVANVGGVTVVAKGAVVDIVNVLGTVLIAGLSASAIISVSSLRFISSG